MVENLSLHARSTPGAIPGERVAVALMFLANGFVIGSWAPKIPEFAARLGLTEGGLGLLIIAFGVGSLAAMPLAGIGITRRGSRPVLQTFAALLVLALPAVTAAGSIPTGIAAVLFLGAAVGGMDVAMNASAVSVERWMGRSIMSSCHGFWSIGGLLGAAAGGFLIDRLGLSGHMLVATLVVVLATALAWRMILADPPAPRKPDARPGLSGLGPMPWLVGAMALMCMIPEGAIMDWGAMYLRQEHGASITQSGFAFAAFSATMAIVRLAGDHVRDRLGAMRAMRLSALIAIAGFLLAGQATGPWGVYAGFALAGIGIANMVPIAFSAGGNLPGVSAAAGLSVVTMMGYSGSLFAPSFLGFIAERTGFALVFTALPVLLLVVILMAGLARYADPAEGDRRP
jgi:MFS family permease